MHRKSLFALGAVAIVSLVSVACGRRDDVEVNVSTSGASGPSGASAGDQWSWAEEKAPSGASPVETEAPRRIETPAPAPAPRRDAPPAKSTNRFETPQERDDREAREDRNDDIRDGDDQPATARRGPVTAEAGSSMNVRLNTALDSETASVGQTVSATLASDLTDGSGRVVLPAGTKLSGSVTEAVSARKLKKKSFLAFQLTRATLPDGRTEAISTGYRAEGKGYTPKDGAIIGGSAAGGAILGQVLGGDSDATAAGAVIGGAIGSGVVMSKKGEEVSIPAGTEMVMTNDIGVTVG